MEKSNVLYVGEIFNELKEIVNFYNEDNFNINFLEDKEDKKKALEEAKYLLTGNDKITEDIMNAARNAVLIQNTGVGCDNINLDYASKKNIPVANAPKSNSIAVAELTIGLILALYRKIIYFNKTTKAGEWHMWNLRPDCFELNEKKHGIIGFGEAGKQVAVRSKAFGTTVFYYDKFKATKEEEEKLGVSYLSFEEIIKTSDILSIHVPLLPETKNLLEAREFKLMKKNAIIINVSREGIVNEKEMYDSLIAGEFAGRALDVWGEEPVKKDNPLLTLEQVISTPHIGAGTLDTMKRVYQICFENIKRMEKGKRPQHVVNEVETIALS